MAINKTMAETTGSLITLVLDHASHKPCCFLMQTGSFYLFLFPTLATLWVCYLLLSGFSEKCDHVLCDTAISLCFILEEPAATS